MDAHRSLKLCWLSITLVLLTAACGPAPTLPPATSGPSPIPPTAQATPLPSPAPTPPPTPAGEHPADILFHNGTLLTMEQAQPQAQALAIRGREILAVGSEESLSAYRGPDTQVIDLEGRTLMPGFVDAHTHVFNDAHRLDMTYEEAQELMLTGGTTTVGNLYATADFLADMRALEEDGRLQVRTSLYLNYSTNCGDVLGEWYLEEGIGPTREWGERVRIGGVKVFADGGTCGAPAMSFELQEGGGTGDLFFTQEELATVVENAQAVGHQVAIHAIGDRAIDAALGAIETALDGEPNTYRHRIEHNSVIRPDQLPRYGEIGAVPTIFATYPNCEPLGAPMPESYQDWEWPWPALIEANPDLHIAWHGDYPFWPQAPVEHLFGFVTRHEVSAGGEVCPPSDWLADDVLPVAQALRMMTMESAYALFREEEVGSLRAGKLADVIVLSENPLAVDPFAIKDIQALMTMVGGQTVWCAPGQEALCPGATGAGPTGTPAPAGPGGDNLALSGVVTPSQALPSNPAAMAVDGDSDTWWGSGGSAPQWIEIDLGRPVAVDSVRLVVSQAPPGETTHVVWGRGPEDTYRELHRFQGPTSDLGILLHEPADPWRDVQVLKIETLESPSWVSWREIEIYGEGEMD